VPTSSVIPAQHTAKIAPRSHAQRKGRESQIGERYHVTFATTNRQRSFGAYASAREMVLALRESDQLGVTQTLAFVVMPDHVHWLFELRTGSLSKAVARVKSQFSRSQRREISVWQSGYYDHAIRCEEDIEKVAGYIVENPIRAGLVDDLGDYAHWDLVWL
jgi:putative transposase